MMTRARTHGEYLISVRCVGWDLRGRLEVELDAELDEAGDQDLGRALPVAERVILIEHRARVECVVDVHVGARARPAEAQQLRKAEIDLMQPVAMYLARSAVGRRVRAWRQQMDVHVRCVAGEWAAEARSEESRVGKECRSRRSP